MFSIFNEIGVSDLLDVALMSFLVYSVLVWFKRTRAAFVLTGILIIAAVYLLARQFNLFLTASVFQGFFAVILVAVVIIFQEELRHFFERVAVLGLAPRFGKKKQFSLDQGLVDILVRTLSDLGRERIGALVVLRGKDMILRHLEGGEELTGRVSEALLKSLFDPHSFGHDGAVIIEEDLVTQFASHLPLSKNFKMLGETGTRHAAGLGLSELSDALCLVVSEERGTISFARHGTLHTLADPSALSHVLENFLHEIHPSPQPRNWLDLFRKNYKEKGFALVIAALLWFLQVFGSKVIYKTFAVPVEFMGLPSRLAVTSLLPPTVEVTFSAPRRTFYLFNKKSIRVLLKSWQMREGTQSVRLTGANLVIPKNIVLERIDPNKVELTLQPKAP